MVFFMPFMVLIMYLFIASFKKLNDEKRREGMETKIQKCIDKKFVFDAPTNSWIMLDIHCEEL